MGDAATLGGLFVLAFVAATILPAQSEAALAALVLAGTYHPALLIAVAGAGNVLGSVVNWGLGRFVDRFSDRRWFPVSVAALDRAARWYARWGHWSLLLSWMPVIGDPLTVAAGVLREPLWRFLLVVGFAKVARYIAVAAVALGWA
jgi:membrane protein YqaA with SNARE-associated domain